MSLEITTTSPQILSAIRLSLGNSFNSVPSTSSIQPFVGNNNASGLFSSVLGGQNNDTNQQSNTFILGSNITAPLPNYTYVENLSSRGNLQVAGTLNISGALSANGGTSDNWNSVYTSVQSQSANNVSTYNTVSSLSGNWSSVYVSVSSLSGYWNQISTLVQTNSTSWGTGGTQVTLGNIPLLSSNWNNSYSWVNANSSAAVFDSISINNNGLGSNYIYSPYASLDTITSYSISAAALSGTFYGDGSNLTNTYILCGTDNQIVVTPNGIKGNSATLSFPTSAVFPGDVVINGSFTANGSATFINTNNLVVEDNIIYLNQGGIGNTLDTGFVSHFTPTGGNYNHTGLIRKAEQGVPGVWTLFSGLTSEPLSASNINWNDPTLTVDTLSANILGNLSGNSVNVVSVTSSDILTTNNLTVGNNISTTNENVSNNLTVGNNISTNTLTTSDSITATNNLTVGNNISASNEYISNNLTVGNIVSASNYYGASDQTIITDGSSLIGYGSNTLALNYLSGVFVSTNLFVPGGSSPLWNSTYTTVRNTSANWSSVYTNVNATSANWSNVYTTVRNTSANWSSAYSTVNSNSATTWNYQGTDLKNLSAGWVGGNSAYSTVNSNSATTWNYQGTDLKSLSSGWQSTYTTVLNNSATWGINQPVTNILFADGSVLTTETNFFGTVDTLASNSIYQMEYNAIIYTNGNGNNTNYAVSGNNTFTVLGDVRYLAYDSGNNSAIANIVAGTTSNRIALGAFNNNTNRLIHFTISCLVSTTNAVNMALGVSSGGTGIATKAGSYKKLTKIS